MQKSKNPEIQEYRNSRIQESKIQKLKNTEIQLSLIFWNLKNSGRHFDRYFDRHLSSPT